MRIIGRIERVTLKKRIIGIKTFSRIIYLYFQNGHINLFKRYLYAGTYIDLDYEEDKTYIKNGIAAYYVNYVHQIFRFNDFEKIQYYDRFQIDNSLSSFLDSLGNIMFLDLEMTMPSYTFKGKGYISEIIQVGYVLVNGMGEEMARYSQYIEPNHHMDLSKRTLNFLKIDAKEFHQNSISYIDFYNDFSMILKKYHPTIVIFGKNDRLMLSESFVLNQVDSLNEYMRFVNLSKLIQTYYHLQNEPGLFKLFQIYYENYAPQSHDAFDDSYVTMAVFNAFKKDVKHETDYFLKIKESFKMQKTISS